MVGLVEFFPDDGPVRGELDDEAVGAHEEACGGEGGGEDRQAAGPVGGVAAGGGCDFAEGGEEGAAEREVLGIAKADVFLLVREEVAASGGGFDAGDFKRECGCLRDGGGGGED